MLHFEPDLSLPYLTTDLPGIGGRLRAVPEHFVVEEVALYEPEDQGSHLYVNLTRVGMTTRDVQQRLEQILALKRGEVGYAGLKDKKAQTTQTFSVPIGNQDDAFADEVVRRIAGEVPVTVHWARRHRNKLKLGHLLGNRFSITVTDWTLPEAETRRRCEVIRSRLDETGIPNFFGPQRFGADGANVGKGFELLRGTRRVQERWLRRFLLSSYQSYLCNCYLARRLADGGFDHLIAGDIAKKYATGGMFEVRDLATEQERYTAKEITFTAPLFGAKMWDAQGEAGELEASILRDAGVAVDDFQRVKVEGTRRLGRLLVTEMTLAVAPGEVTLAFFLPKGAFATTVLREFMKVELADAPEFDGEESQ
jgi:tRNA pseudouridine13 synthase